MQDITALTEEQSMMYARMPMSGKQARVVSFDCLENLVLFLTTLCDRGVSIRHD